MPSAHTGRMRWKSCVFDGSFCFFPVFTCHLISRLRRQLPLKGKPLPGRIHWCNAEKRLFDKLEKSLSERTGIFYVCRLHFPR